MRLLLRLLVVFTICLAGIALPTAPVQAYGASITLSPSSGMPGTEVTVYGHNFTPDDWVDVYYYLNGDRAWAAEVRTNGDGDFEVTYTIPDSCKGDHEILAEDAHAISASDYFTVEPGLAIDPEEGTAGSVVTVQGLGFAEDEEDIELRYYLNGEYVVIEDGITADENGSWEISFQIFCSARGSHKLDAQGAESRLYEVEDAIFEATPSIGLDKSSGSVGETLTMSGAGFMADERHITVLFEGEAVVTEIGADENGCWEASFIVPNMPAGTYSITAEGENTPKEDIAALSFAIEVSAGRCFAATAAYGTPMAPDVQILREFRDECLLTNRLGQAFVTFYYKLSPPIAEFITKHPSLKPIVRATLLPAVVMSTVTLNTTATEKAVTLGILVLALVVVAIFVTRRRGRDSEHARV